MEIVFSQNGNLIPININSIPILSKEQDFKQYESKTMQHFALRLDMLEKISSNLTNSKLFVEFGVYKGDTAKKILEMFPDFETHLFDSFEGLPEDWDEYFTKGFFSLKEKEIPNFNSYKNVKIHKGYFDKTIPVFVEYLKKEEKSLDFIHIDCDLYSSTKTIFDNLNPFIKSGTIIHFDELLGIGTWYKDWKNGEYKALLEWAVDNKRSFEYLARSDYTQVTIKIN